MTTPALTPQDIADINAARVLGLSVEGYCRMDAATSAPRPTVEQLADQEALEDVTPPTAEQAAAPDWQVGVHPYLANEHILGPDAVRAVFQHRIRSMADVIEVGRPKHGLGSIADVQITPYGEPT